MPYLLRQPSGFSLDGVRSRRHLLLLRDRSLRQYIWAESVSSSEVHWERLQSRGQSLFSVERCQLPHLQITYRPGLPTWYLNSSIPTGRKDWQDKELDRWTQRQLGYSKSERLLLEWERIYNLSLTQTSHFDWRSTDGAAKRRHLTAYLKWSWTKLVTNASI